MLLEAARFSDLGTIYYEDGEEEPQVVHAAHPTGWNFLRSAVRGWRVKKSPARKQPEQQQRAAVAEEPAPPRRKVEDAYFRAIANAVEAKPRSCSDGRGEEPGSARSDDGESEVDDDGEPSAESHDTPAPRLLSLESKGNGGRSRAARDARSTLPRAPMAHLARVVARPSWALPLGARPASTTTLVSRKPLGYNRLVSEALHGDVLASLAELVGLRRLHVFALVCTAWHDATRAKLREWGVLLYVKALGKGRGQLRAQLDMPTWLCMVPDGEWGTALCVVDACNYRLVLMRPSDGEVCVVA